jgi:hypothetical protein
VLRIGDPLVELDVQEGGATQITNLYYEATDVPTDSYQTITQLGVSRHGITARRCITDPNDPFSFGDEVVFRSRYFWNVFCEIENGNLSGGYPNINTVDVLILFDHTGWSFVFFGGTPLGWTPIGQDQCSGIISNEWTVGTVELSFTMEVVGGLQLPSGFTCTDGFIHKNGRRFYGTKSSFPSNYFPTS